MSKKEIKKARAKKLNKQKRRRLAAPSKERRPVLRTAAALLLAVFALLATTVPVLSAAYEKATVHTEETITADKLPQTPSAIPPETVSEEREVAAPADEPSEQLEYETHTVSLFDDGVIENGLLLPISEHIVQTEEIQNETEEEIADEETQTEDDPVLKKQKEAVADKEAPPPEEAEEKSADKENKEEEKQPAEKKEVYYISVYDTSKKKKVKMELEDYVLHVLAGEICADKSGFEALKAQAVAIRSYALSKDRTGCDGHHGAQTCTSSYHCMAFKSDKDYKKLPSATKKLYERAVNETKGQVLTYNGKIAHTFFHDCSYGYTESCADVFGTHLPYLVPVYCGYETDKIDTVSFSCLEILEKLLGSRPGARYYARLADEDKGFANLVETEGGRIGSVDICGVTVKGTALRSALGLRSTKIDIAYDAPRETFVLTVYGFGHGVGLSQDGAIDQAHDGKSYGEILSYFYPGTVLSLLDAKSYPKY